MKSAPDPGGGASRPDARFVRLRGARRVWAIAVIRGEAQRLARLHDTIGERLQVGDRAAARSSVPSTNSSTFGAVFLDARAPATPSCSRPSGTPAFTEDRGLFFVHAAVEPSRPLSEQRDAFWWGREDILELKEPFAGFRRVVRGVDRERRSVVEREFAVSVDGGGGRDGRLIAAGFGLDGAVVDIAEA